MYIVDLVLGNLSKVLDMLWNARDGWINLGLALGIDHTTLKVIKKDNANDTDACFTEMISVWLKMDPPPTCETLVAALKAPSVGERKLAKKLKKQLGLAFDPDEQDGMLCKFMYNIKLSTLYRLCYSDSRTHPKCYTT